MKIIDHNRFYLPGTGNRFLHLATVHEGVREFICFIDVPQQKTYIEEITGGHLEWIADDALAEELTNFLTEKGILDIGRPALPDKQWLYGKKDN